MKKLKKYFKKHTRPRAVDRMIHPALKVGYWALGVVGFFAAWTLIAYLMITRKGLQQFAGFLPVPTMKALYGLFSEADFWDSAYASIRRVTVGIAQALCFGLPVGILVGFYRKLRMITYPPIQFVRMISPLSWINSANNLALSAAPPLFR